MNDGMFDAVYKISDIKSVNLILEATKCVKRNLRLEDKS